MEQGVLSVVLEDDGTFPNNQRPLLLYPGAVPADPSAIESTAHEALGVYSGSAAVQFGGPKGVSREVRAGDVVVIPAGVARQCLQASPDFGVVGAYPGGQRRDMCYSRPGERPEAERRIAALGDPEADPVQGAGGALGRLWKGPMSAGAAG